MKVAVLGGGIAGLSAAHELVERGFEVEVHELRDIFGGKARSIEIPNTAVDGRRPLPGEHGFRFFPGFYKHLPDTMSRIPVGGGRCADENLVAATEMLLARHNAEEVVVPSGPPKTPRQIWQLVAAATGAIGIPTRELVDFWMISLEFMTSSDSRRFRGYEYDAWWEYVEAEGHGENYQKFLGQGATRSLVAMQAEKSSTRTIGTIYFQMLRDLANPFVDVDRVLNGPTNEVWIDPWVDYLRGEGVVLFNGHRVSEIVMRDVADEDVPAVASVRVETPDGVEELEADWYILALPVEVVCELLDDELTQAAPRLNKLPNLETAWMNGIQFFLDRDVVVSNGHGLYLDSAWSLTSISQAQFWERPLAEYGDGTVRGILSVVISNWEEEGTLIKKPANACSRDEIRQEVWHQLEEHLNDDEFDDLDDARIVHWFLDDSIVHPNPNQAVNLEPLMINTTGSWDDRPDADIGLDNLLLASDYVRTNTDLATMEAANEAARRAVNVILRRSGSREKRCRIWPLKEWGIFAGLKALDRWLHDRGKPHIFELIKEQLGR